jgi:hypothetical protein
LPQEVKIQNGEWISFYKKFYMVFRSILQNDKSKPKIFWMKWRTKHTLNAKTRRIEKKEKHLPHFTQKILGFGPLFCRMELNTMQNF